MSQLQFGPTTPLQPAPPTPKDIVESEHMVDIIQRHSVVNKSAYVLSYVESVAHVMVTLCNLKRQQQYRAENGISEEDVANSNSSAAVNGEMYPTWAKAFAFGSSGLEANVASSDIDVYVGRVPPHATPSHSPLSPPFFAFNISLISLRHMLSCFSLDCWCVQLRYPHNFSSLRSLPFSSSVGWTTQWSCQLRVCRW